MLPHYKGCQTSQDLLGASSLVLKDIFLPLCINLSSNHTVRTFLIIKIFKNVNVISWYSCIYVNFRVLSLKLRLSKKKIPNQYLHGSKLINPNLSCCISCYSVLQTHFSMKYTFLDLKSLKPPLLKNLWKLSSKEKLKIMGGKKEQGVKWAVPDQSHSQKARQKVKRAEATASKNGDYTRACCG